MSNTSTDEHRRMQTRARIVLAMTYKEYQRNRALAAEITARDPFSSLGAHYGYMAAELRGTIYALAWIHTDISNAGRSYIPARWVA